MGDERKEQKIILILKKKFIFCIYNYSKHFWCYIDCCIGNEFKIIVGWKEKFCVHLTFVLSNFMTLHLMLTWSFQYSRIRTGNLLFLSYS